MTLLTAVAVAVAAIVTACVPARAAIGPSADPDALRVTATTTVLADIVKSVGGTRTSVQSIVPPGVGPEDYEPRPADARSIADAQLLVSNGVGLDTFLDRLIRSAGGDDAPRLVLGDGLPAIEVDGEPNPHFWLDPTIVRDDWLPKIVEALSAAAPGDRATFEANAAAYAKELTALDAELAAQVATIPPANRKLVTFHDAFPYFARHFGFELVGVVLANVGQEPTAGRSRGAGREGQGGRRQGRVLGGPVQPEARPDARRRGGRPRGRDDALQRRPRAGPGGHLSRHDAVEHAADRRRPPMTVPTTTGSTGTDSTTRGAAGAVVDAGPAVRLEDVTAGYGSRVALADVSLDVRRGSLLAVIGPNGAGKSTLLKVIAGLLEPFSGSVSVLGGHPARAPTRSPTSPRPRRSTGTSP